MGDICYIQHKNKCLGAFKPYKAKIKFPLCYCSPMDFKLYENSVRRLTKEQNLDSLESLDLPIASKFKDLRSNDYKVLDHKMSIFWGYLKKVPPHLIADVSNLRWLGAKDNNVKGRGCVSDAYNSHLLRYLDSYTS